MDDYSPPPPWRTGSRPAPSCDNHDHQNGCDCTWARSLIERTPPDCWPDLTREYNKRRGEIRGEWDTIQGLRDDNQRRIAANAWLRLAVGAVGGRG